MNMKQWLQEMLEAPAKKAMPILSFPSASLLGMSVAELLSTAENQAAGIAANYVISAGGNVVIRGLAEGKRLWTVGVRDPQSADPTAHVTAVQAEDEAVVTSGGY